MPFLLVAVPAFMSMGCERKRCVEESLFYSKGMAAGNSVAGNVKPSAFLLPSAAIAQAIAAGDDHVLEIVQTLQFRDADMGVVA